MGQQLNVLEIKFDVVTNEYKWYSVLHLLEGFRISHTLHGLIESFTRLLAFSKCNVEETHELQDSLVTYRPQGHNGSSGSTQECSGDADHTLGHDLPVTGYFATRETRHQRTRHQGKISPPTYSPPSEFFSPPTTNKEIN